MAAVATTRMGVGARSRVVAVGVEMMVVVATTAGAGVRETAWWQQLWEQEQEHTQMTNGEPTTTTSHTGASPSLPPYLFISEYVR